MECARNELLAGAGLAEDEDVGAAVRGEHDLVDDALHDRGAPDDHPLRQHGGLSSGRGVGVFVRAETACEFAPHIAEEVAAPPGELCGFHREQQLGLRAAQDLPVRDGSRSGECGGVVPVGKRTRDRRNVDLGRGRFVKQQRFRRGDLARVLQKGLRVQQPLVRRSTSTLCIQRIARAGPSSSRCRESVSKAGVSQCPELSSMSRIATSSSPVAISSTKRRRAQPPVSPRTSKALRTTLPRMTRPFSI